MTTTTTAEMALVLLEGLRGRDSGLVIDDYQHSLQTATRAQRDGATPEIVVAALLHDAGKAVTTGNHGRVAAEMVSGFVPRRVVWTLAMHQDFTAIELPNGHGRYARYKHVLHPSYRFARRFVDDWDLPSRDPDYDTLPVEHFSPMVHEVLRYRPRPRSLARRVGGRIRRFLR